MAEKVKFTVEVEDKGGIKTVDGLNKKIKETQKESQKTKKGLAGIWEELGNVKGPVGNAVQGINGMSQAFKALLANPVVLVITAIVGSLSALYKAFTSTKEGGEKMQQVFAGLGAVMDVFRDLANKLTGILIDMFNNPTEYLKKFGQLLVDNVVNRFKGLFELIPKMAKSMGYLFEGEFKKAISTAGDAIAKVTLGVDDLTNKVDESIKAVGNLVSEISKEAKAAADVEKNLQRLANAERQLTIDKAKQQKQIEANRAIADDENKSLETRRAALLKANQMEEKLIARETSIAQQRYNLIKRKNSLTAETVEGIQQESEALTKMYEMQNQLAAKQNEKLKSDKDLAIRIEEQKLIGIQTAYTGIVATYGQAAEIQRQLRDEETSSIEERAKANETLALILEEGQKKERDNINERINGLKAINKQYGESPERLNEIMALTEELKGVDEKYEGLKSEQLTNRVSLQKEGIDLQRAEIEGTIEANKIIAQANADMMEDGLKKFEAQKKLLDEEYNKKEELANGEIAKYKEGTQAYVDAVNEKKLLDAQYAADSKALSKEVADYKKEQEKSVREETIDSFNQIMDVSKAFLDNSNAQLDKDYENRMDNLKKLGYTEEQISEMRDAELQKIDDRARRNFEIAKNINYAQTLLSAIQGTQDAFTSATKSTITSIFPAYPFLQAAAAAAFGAAQLQQIGQSEYQSKITPSAGSGGSSFGASGGPSVGIVSSQMNQTNQLQAQLNSQMSKPTRAYVVGQNVTSQQSLDRHIAQNATL